MARYDDSFDLIDAIYEAGAAPSLWPAAIDRVCAAIGGAGGMLFGARDNYQGTLHSKHLTGAFDRFFAGGFAAQDPTLPRGMQLNHPGFVTDQDLFDDDLIATHPVYDFFRREGIGFRAGTIIPNPSGDLVAISFLRHQDNGPVPRQVVSRLDSLRPHLARASMLSFRFGFEQAKAQTEALQAIGLPGAVLRGAGRLFAANPLFDALMPTVLQDRRSRIALNDTAADSIFAPALETLAFAQSARSIPVPRGDGHVPMVIHLIPIRGAAHDIFAQATALLIVTPIDRGAVPTAEVLQGLFDLTPTEAHVARSVGAAQSVEEVATAQGVSRETIRSQLKAVLGKTGLSRQSELVSLLASVGQIG